MSPECVVHVVLCVRAHGIRVAWRGAGSCRVVTGVWNGRATCLTQMLPPRGLDQLIQSGICEVAG